MCQPGSCSHLKRNLCACFTFYIVFGLRINCGLFCCAQVNSIEKENDLFRVVSNRSTINQKELEHFLSSLSLLPPDGPNEHPGDPHGCHSPEELIRMKSNTGELSKDQFIQLLPVIVHELASKSCLHDHEVTGVTKSSLGWQTIVATIASVLVISASGLVVVAVLPYIPERYYHVAVQFLIALSVGSLIGDAFLHLIPHALYGSHGDEPEEVHGHEDHDASHAKHDHLTIIVKSIMAVLGVYVFFLSERLTILCQNRKARRNAKRELVLTLTESTAVKDREFATVDGPAPNGVTAKTRKADDASTWVPLATRTSTGSTIEGNNCSADGLGVVSDLVKPPCVANQFCNRPPERPLDNAHCEDHLKGYLGSSTEYYPLKPGNADPADQSDVVQNPGHQAAYPMYGGDPYNQPNAEKVDVAAHSVVDLRLSQENLSSNPKAVHHHAAGKLVTIESHLSGVISPSAAHRDGQTHLHRDRPHGHHHGHSHDLSSVRAIAYTIIAGDGLHNFFDGIAIGAAFANSLRGGLSTAIAVLCHELPHEVGDFAVLLNAGISVKVAIFCNFLSSVCCAIGAAIGLSVGRLESVDTWLFMLTAGMFVYIALVDMMPELATDKLQGHRLCHRPSVLFVWQNFGIILGCVIMLMIALYEGHVL